MVNYLRNVLLFLLFEIGSFITSSAQTKYTETYSVEGIYVEVSESEALDNYHYLEYDDHYYIKKDFQEGEKHSLTIKEVINPKLYEVVWEEDGELYIYFMNLRYPSYLWKGEGYDLSYSRIIDSEIIKQADNEFQL